MTLSNESEYWIFCDESDRLGKFYSNFYGGVRIAASKLDGVNRRLMEKKKSLGLNSEAKWVKTDKTTSERYKELIGAFFDEVDQGNLVMRVMFTKNSNVANGLTALQIRDSYYILYYQLIKHEFDLQHMPPHVKAPRLRIYLDHICATEEQTAKFKGYIESLSQNSQIRRSGLILDRHDIAHVCSHDHILMQCLDIVLGSITFRLNNKHLEKPEGALKRGKRTIAKAKLYKFINQRIRQATGKQFNIGISTALPIESERWNMPYRHWLFTPKNSTHDHSKTK